MEFGESILHAAARETYEEVGLKVKPIGVIAVGEETIATGFHERKHFIYFEVLCRLLGGRVKIDGREITEYKWFALRDARRIRTYPMIAKTIRTIAEMKKGHADFVDNKHTLRSCKNLSIYPCLSYSENLGNSMARRRLMATSGRNRRAKKEKSEERKRMKEAAKRKVIALKRKAISREDAKKAPAFGTALDFEDIIAENMIRKPRKEELPKSALTVVEAIYSSSPGLGKIAYRHGFSLGKNIYSRSNGTLNTLLSALENGGLENILYYPFNDSLVITASGGHPKKINGRMHIYESGLIAGYLTSATGTQIYVEETECEYDGDNRCRFVSSSGIGFGEKQGGNRNLEEIISGVSEIAKIDGNVSAGYYAAAILPIAGRSSSEPLANFFYMAGSRLGAAAELGLGEIAGIAGASSFEVAKKYRKIPKLVRLRYAPANSIGPFVDAAASAVAGFLKQRYGYEPEMRRRLLKNNKYLIELSAKS